MPPIIEQIKSALGMDTAQTESEPAAPVQKTEDKLPQLPDQEVFDHEKVEVIFVLGGPGAGASLFSVWQCDRLVVHAR